jgi:flavin reductase (DIM6/NTAB) family NADH-FMN oxidoreductase RutF
MTDPLRQRAAALGRIPSGLFILTARRGDAETGMLASWVQQCAFEPPHLSCALKQGRLLTEWLVAGTPFTVNILDDAQTDMVAHFGRGFALGEPAFEGLEIERPDGGAPVLSEALAYLNCQVKGHSPVGDHDLFLGLIVSGRVLNEGHPMVHVRKSGLHY